MIDYVTAVSEEERRKVKLPSFFVDESEDEIESGVD
jgi:hypothetical protein